MTQPDQIGKIEIVPVRQAFPREATDFTGWLEQNIDALSERIGVSLTVLEREKSIGAFSVDLVCEDDSGRMVIIENQLERTNHDHLGKLLTYLVNLNASIAIWVSPEPRQEHERVIEWLNEITGADMAFYLVRVEAICIGGPPYAPLFTVVAAPDEQSREIGETKKDLAERHHRRLDFWTELVSRARGRAEQLARRAPGHESWLGIGAGRGGIQFNCSILRDAANVELYIDTGNYDRNKAFFDALYADKDAIEQEFRAPLDWQRLDERRACRVVFPIVGQGGLNDPESWPDIQETMIEAFIKLDRTFRPRLKRIEA